MATATATIETPVVDFYGMDRKTALAFAWQTTHPDFRGTIEGERTILRNIKGATCLCFIKDTPDAELQEMVRMGLRLQSRKLFAAKGVTVFADGAHEWAGGFDADRRPVLASMHTGAIEALPFDPAPEATHDQRMSLAYDLAMSAAAERNGKGA